MLNGFVPAPLTVSWICVAHAGVWTGDDEAAVRVIRGKLLILGFMREVLERLLMQFEFLELHFCTLSTGHYGHTSHGDRLPT